jgi:YVTN family beta-propeller protein
VYAADTDGDKVYVLDATTRAEAWNITVGAGPMSMDVSPDGQHLYVAVSGDMCVAIVDLEERTVSENILLTFHPLSIRIGLSGRLYLTNFPDETYPSSGLKVVDEASGVLLETQDVIGNCVLEMSPDKTTLLMLSLGTTPAKVRKFSCAGPALVLLDEDNHDLGQNGRQMAVDWIDGLVYLVSALPYGIEVLSLDTLDKVGFMLAEAYPAGVALSPDRGTVFCTTIGGKDQLWAFYASNGTYMAKYKMRESCLDIDLSTYAAVAAPTGAGSVVAVGKPAQFLALSAPVLFPGSPTADQLIELFGYEYSWNITSDVFVGVPPVAITSWAMELDGMPLTSSMENHVISGMVPGPITEGGRHEVHAQITWAGGLVEVDWFFNSSEEESILSFWPSDGSRLEYVPQELNVSLDLGFPERVLLDSEVTLNGESAPYEQEGSVISVRTSSPDGILAVPGDNLMHLNLRFSHLEFGFPVYTNIELEWSFMIQNVSSAASYEGLRNHTLWDGVSVMLPDEWIVEENVTVGDAFFVMRATSSTDIVNTVPSVISLQSGVDPEIVGDELYLSTFPEMFFKEMNDAGYSAYMVEAPDFREISGHSAVVFGIRWYSQTIVQKVAVLVDTSTGEYWIMIATTQPSCYYDLNPMFEGVIMSIDTPAGGIDSPAIVEAILLVVLAVAVAVLAVMVVVGLGLWPRAKAPPPR